MVITLVSGQKTITVKMANKKKKTTYQKKITSVMDEFGRVVLTSKSNTIDVSNLSNGVYILRINNTTKKIIIRK